MLMMTALLWLFLHRWRVLTKTIIILRSNMELKRRRETNKQKGNESKVDVILLVLLNRCKVTFKLIFWSLITIFRTFYSVSKLPINKNKCQICEKEIIILFACEIQLKRFKRVRSAIYQDFCRVTVKSSKHQFDSLKKVKMGLPLHFLKSIAIMQSYECSKLLLIRFMQR